MPLGKGHAAMEDRRCCYGQGEEQEVELEEEEEEGGFEEQDAVRTVVVHLARARQSSSPPRTQRITPSSPRPSPRLPFLPPAVPRVPPPPPPSLSDVDKEPSNPSPGPASYLPRA